MPRRQRAFTVGPRGTTGSAGSPAPGESHIPRVRRYPSVRASSPVPGPQPRWVDTVGGSHYIGALEYSGTMNSEHNPQTSVDENRFSMWAEILKAAAHPTRLSILSQLLNSPRCVTALHELLDVRQTGVSQHLSVLKHAGLVAFKRRGASRCYYLPRPELVGAIFDLLARDYRQLSVAEVEKRIDRALDARRRSRSASPNSGPSPENDSATTDRSEGRSAIPLKPVVATR